MTRKYPDRVHLIAHANPATRDVKQLGFRDKYLYLEFIRDHLPDPFILTCNPDVLFGEEREWHGGRQDDAARIADLQAALDDHNTAAIVALAGGAYFTRLLPHLDFSALARRRQPLWAFGFSEMTTFVNLVASYSGGRGVYWLGPNYLGRKIRPARTARAAFGEYWKALADILSGRRPQKTRHLSFGPITGRLVNGTVRPGKVRLLGGCLTVLITMLAGPLGRRLQPEGKWLMLEDLQEAPYRVDRHLATLKLAGWFDRVAGVLLGAFHTDGANEQRAVLELLRFHLPQNHDVPIVVSNSFGHLWPMVPAPLALPLDLSIRGKRVIIEADFGAS